MRKKGTAKIPSKNDPQKFPANCEAREAKPTALQQSHARKAPTRSAKTHLACARRLAKDEKLSDRIRGVSLKQLTVHKLLTLANLVNMQR
jgi:hypothetical protein